MLFPDAFIDTDGTAEDNDPRKDKSDQDCYGRGSPHCCYPWYCGYPDFAPKHLGQLTLEGTFLFLPLLLAP